MPKTDPVSRGPSLRYDQPVIVALIVAIVFVLAAAIMTFTTVEVWVVVVPVVVVLLMVWRISGHAQRANRKKNAKFISATNRLGGGSR